MLDNIRKLADDELDVVSGRTNSEMLDIQNALHTKNLKELIEGLKAHGIIAELSSLKKTSYRDRNTEKELSHEEVLALLKMN